MFFNIQIILLYTKYGLKIELKVNTVAPSITRTGFRPKGNMIHSKTSKKKKENIIIERKIFWSDQKLYYKKNPRFSRTLFNSVLCFPIWWGPSLNVFSMKAKSGLGIFSKALCAYEHVWVYKIQMCLYHMCTQNTHTSTCTMFTPPNT